eukprot:GEMP01080874.1.p1 GENE.GEMP01080874.1~~GEMP01080874.1.p1  ORF type:complete len:353 (+),score=66.33 GEMP01080874.1:31-1059(+)
MATSVDAANWAQEIQKAKPSGCLVVFYATWHAPSVQLTTVADGIATQFKHIAVLKVDVDKNRALCDKVDGVEAVPKAVFLQPNGTVVDSVDGADPPKVFAMVTRHAATKFSVEEVSATPTQDAPTQSDLDTRLKELINFSPVMVFMKGAKQNPFCKFSKVAVAILNEYNIDYATFDIFQDNEVREGLKKFSNWPTYPQLYVNGELLGGVDILKEMHEDGSLKDALPQKAVSESQAATENKGSALEDRLKALITKEPIMLFMKGSPDAPQCGFSSSIVGILNKVGVAYGKFDILQDEEVRQGLKTFSNWPTFPQLYANGQLVGGVDIVKELYESDELLQELEN